jgi:hypothetical protein
MLVMAQQPMRPSNRLAIERDHEERALAERLREAARRPPEENLAAGLALMRTAEEFRAAFAKPTSR